MKGHTYLAPCANTYKGSTEPVKARYELTCSQWKLFMFYASFGIISSSIRCVNRSQPTILWTGLGWKRQLFTLLRLPSTITVITVFEAVGRIHTRDGLSLWDGLSVGDNSRQTDNTPSFENGTVLILNGQSAWLYPSVFPSILRDNPSLV